MTWLYLWVIWTQAPIVAEVGQLPMEVAIRHVHAAYAARTDRIPADILLAIAWSESGFDSRWVSRVEDGDRVIGIVSRRDKPIKAKGPYYCGTHQLEALSWEQCLLWRDSFEASYVEAARHLTEWYDTHVCSVDVDPMRCALLGYNGGWAGVAKGNSYAVGVRARARKLTLVAN